ncbi:MAG: hypothetical protein ACYC8T_01735 [Myxococcaceae bacterium]
MRTLVLAVLASTWLCPAAALAQAEAEGDKAAPEGAAAANETQLAPLQAREVIERLKTMRAQILLDEEYNRLLEARVKRQELEEKLSGATPAAAKKKTDAPRVGIPPPPSLERGAAAAGQLTVKSVTVAPFKEAFVVYKGRTYTVRPGDTLGDITIRDITQSGVVTNRAAVMLEQ